MRAADTVSGYIYIAGSFHNINRSKCGRGGEWIDNGPHFWTSPPTWGICRPDLREKVSVGDVVFFVLPIKARHPQMIFGYITVKDKITHVRAFANDGLISKRMSNNIPNGNIMLMSAAGTTDSTLEYIGIISIGSSSTTL